MNVEQEIQQIKEQLKNLSESKTKETDYDAMDASIDWVNEQIEKKEKNLFWKTFFISVIYHTAIPMFIFLLGITIGVFLGLDSK